MPRALFRDPNAEVLEGRTELPEALFSMATDVVRRERAICPSLC